MLFHNRGNEKFFKSNGFEIKRCDLCMGRSCVRYEREYQSLDPCPKCLEKRYLFCSNCFGIGKRIRF
ncbi:hypothetical protein T484DRAFT_1989109 [Baffinella frigidus]|nr:hypothetical protein T484DRAFT_1989109 [Cryptophyta sp. CCMP2293]